MLNDMPKLVIGNVSDRPQSTTRKMPSRITLPKKPIPSTIV